MPSGVLGGKNSKLKARGCFFCDSMSALVGEVGSEPALGLLERERLAAGGGRRLIPPPPFDPGVARGRVRGGEDAPPPGGGEGAGFGRLSTPSAGGARRSHG